MKALSNNGMTVEDVDIEMASGSAGPILGPSHDGRWLILRGPTGRILRWLCAEAGRLEEGEEGEEPHLVCPAHPIPAAREIARESGAIKWLVK